MKPVCGSVAMMSIRGLHAIAARHVRNLGEKKPDERFSHIVIGAGSAGCVMANRLTEDKENTVLLLEAGPADAWWNWKIKMPAALMYNLCNDKYNWYYHTEPQKHCDNRVMYWPRGRVYGGSSSLNAMAYVRGHAYDYDRWGREGASGWSYAACLPYFKKAQRHNLGASAYRGDNGPLGVTRGPCDNPLHKAWMKAGVEAGYGYTSDMNGYRQEGVGPMDMTIWKGVRCSASRAYLKEYRDNLFGMTRVLVNRIVFNGKRAIGVEYIDANNEVKKVYCDEDVVLCGGAINSPQLLLLSGVGPSAELKAHEIDVIHDLPGVGKNLQDHLEIYVQQACSQPVSLYDKSSWKFPHNMIRIGLQWFLSQTGEGATSHLESGGFVRTDLAFDHPNLQFHFLPSTVHDHGRVNGNEHAYQVHAGTLRATSRGTVTLKSKNPRDHPKLDPNYLATEEDRAEFRDSIRVSREIFAQDAFGPFRGREMAPGVDCESDEELDAFVRAKCDSAYHPSCTLPMGRSSDPKAVVCGETMRVHGLEGLRVVDASVMPSIVSGNLNAPTIMLAERAADLVRNRKPIDPLTDVPVWKTPSDTLRAGGDDTMT